MAYRLNSCLSLPFAIFWYHSRKSIETVQPEKAGGLGLQVPRCSAAALILLLLLSCEAFLAFYDILSKLTMRVGLGPPFALNLSCVFSLLSRNLTSCRLALQCYICFKLGDCFFQYPHWPGGISTEVPSFWPNSQHWPPHAILSLTFPCYQNHFLSCAFSVHSGTRWQRGVT